MWPLNKAMLAILLCCCRLKFSIWGYQQLTSNFPSIHILAVTILVPSKGHGGLGSCMETQGRNWSASSLQACTSPPFYTCVHTLAHTWKYKGEMCVASSTQVRTPLTFYTRAREHPGARRTLPETCVYKTLYSMALSY